MPTSCLVNIAAISALCVAPLTRADDSRPIAGQPYAGLTLRDNAEGTVVGWVLPGPLDGRGMDSPTLRRGDLVVSANGKAVNAEGFKALLETLHPGDELALLVKRGAKSDPKAAVPVGDPDGEEISVSVRLQSRDTWTGTIGRGAPAGSQVREPERGEFEDRIRELARRTGGWEGDDSAPGAEGLIGYLRETQNRVRDAQPCREVVDAFRRPLSVDRVESRIAAAVQELVKHPDEGGVRTFVDAVFSRDLAAPPGDLNDAVGAFKREPAIALVRHLRDSVSIEGESAAELIHVIRTSGAAMLGQVFLPGTRLSLEAAEQDLAQRAADAKPLSELPPELAGAVTGDVLYAFKLDDGRYSVVGGSGANTYQMDVVAVVYDTGGDDHYRFVPPMPEHARKPDAQTGHAIIDLGGDDVYESTDDFCGPGVAIGGSSMIDDRAGNDIYRATGQFGLAAGLFGIGVIIDRAGDDRYENAGPKSGWSEGVGFYGAGVILDLAGADLYAGEKLVQGVGGPSGFGAIIDAGGDDKYAANGPNFKSAYDTPGVFLAMSQGFGFGVRGYASGGVGAIYDLGGNDHYDAGEFSQGCGYSFAMGLIHDAAGDDVYHGNRYSQAAAAHQAVGVLIDDAGDDTYIGKTAASQAGAWDQSIAMLIDRAGDDAYTADGLCQGAAAQQALAMLIDLGGSDRYQAAGEPDSPGRWTSVQGCGGGNEYHFAADKMVSFSLLLDAGKGRDLFSAGRSGVMATGAGNADHPEQSTKYGVFADE